MDPVTSGVEFIVISAEGFQPLAGNAKDSEVFWGSWISFGYYFKVWSLLD